MQAVSGDAAAARGAFRLAGVGVDVVFREVRRGDVQPDAVAFGKQVGGGEGLYRDFEGAFARVDRFGLIEASAVADAEDAVGDVQRIATRVT